MISQARVVVVGGGMMGVGLLYHLAERLDAIPSGFDGYRLELSEDG
ncbi:MAG: hypothetical protein JRD03_05265, partial [Deltaproteobacteria bacterium]|nr:hypothetical protein [Deltaproteobacteria bacterium]